MLSHRSHVLKDLRPYVCTVEDCKDPTAQFDSRFSFLQHEISQHELTAKSNFTGQARWHTIKSIARVNASFPCIFCGEKVGGEDHRRDKHVGRHMEEIAFAVVRKPYEEWDFYSDSSSSKSQMKIDPHPLFPGLRSS